RILRFPHRESSFFFAYSFQNLSPAFVSLLGLPSHSVSAHRRSVEAHYRESENSGKCFFEKKMTTDYFLNFTPVFTAKSPFYAYQK
ncbi:hypothetical protein ACV0WE_003110, partial [Providencia stuartii]